MKPAAPSLRTSELAERLRLGEAVIFPTDTLPALAATPHHAEQLWRIKQRPANKPVILMGASADALWQALGVAPLPAWQTLAERHWPGALTLVLPASSRLTALLNPGGASLGVRIPDCPAALALLEASGPLATTSANRSGEPPCLCAMDARERFPDVARLAPEPWPTPSGQASTVLAWEPVGQWRLLRAGDVLPHGITP
jgi:L-threonylcarbamoyladenylate synthase